MILEESVGQRIDEGLSSLLQALLNINYRFKLHMENSSSHDTNTLTSQRPQIAQWLRVEAFILCLCCLTAVSLSRGAEGGDRKQTNIFEQEGQSPRDMDELGHGDLSLKTARLLLRKPCEHDADSMFEYACNENVSRYTSWETHKSIEDTKSFIAMSEACFGQGYGVGPFVILNKETPDKVIGTIGCFNVPSTDKCMELGIAICEKYWRKGIATEASREVINYAFSNFDLEKLQFQCAIENKASLALARRLGFQYEGELRNIIWCKGKYWTMNSLSMLKDDWSKNQHL